MAKARRSRHYATRKHHPPELTKQQEETAMKKIQGFAACMMAVVVGISLIGFRIAQAQVVLSIFTSDFRLANQSTLLTGEKGRNPARVLSWHFPAREK